MNTRTRKQKFYGMHGEETKTTSFDKFHRGTIFSLDYEPTKRWVATGSMCLNPEVCIWEVDTLNFVSKFKQGKKTKAVGLIKFLM